METSLKSKIAYVVLGIAISVGCIYYMLEPLNRKAISTMKEHLEDPQIKPGPFDEAMSKSLDSLGVEHTVNKPWTSLAKPRPLDVFSD